MGTSSHIGKPSEGSGAPETPGKASRRLVAFDFDGTLTIRDSFMAFLAWRVSRARFVSGILKLAPASAAYVLNRDRNVLKARAVAEFLIGTPREALEREAEAFRDAVWDRFMRPDALETWGQWGSVNDGEGAERVIVTASPETLIAPFAARLGADRLIGTRLRFDAEDRVAGGFIGLNCRGQEKVDRLRVAYGPGVELAAAYGDTSGDREMISMAEIKGYQIFTGHP